MLRDFKELPIMGVSTVSHCTFRSNFVRVLDENFSEAASGVRVTERER